MKKLFPFLLILISILVSCSSNKKKALEHFDKASLYLKNDDYGNASKEIDLAYQLDSTNYDYQILKAKIKSETDNDDDAIQILKSLLVKHFKEDTVNYLIGNCYFGKGYYYFSKKQDETKEIEAYQNSLIYLDLALKKNSQYFEAYNLKSKSLHNLERYDEALITLNNAIAIFPDSMILIYNQGLEKHYLGDDFGAIIDLDKAIKSNQLDSFCMSEAYRFHGIIFYEKDSLEKAIDDLTIAINYDSENELAYAVRGGYFAKKGLKDKACADYRKAADLGAVAIYPTIKEYCRE